MTTADWHALRLQSLAPRGFGPSRSLIWHAPPSPLHHSPLFLIIFPSGPSCFILMSIISIIPTFSTEHNPHQDERQIRLDTDRSFVLYPIDDAPEDVRLARQTELNMLIVKLFRRRPGLNYFQGFHDIATVFQLTLPPEIALYALEKLSLHRLRDSMGDTLEPLTGLMLILQRLLRLADPSYAMFLEEHAPLPYAALPHLLTLFAHAAPTLPLIQHIFDYLLVRPPLIIVYLVAAMTLTRKDQVLKVGDGDDEGMIHSVLTGLPEFVDYVKVHNDDQSQPYSEPMAAVLKPSDLTPGWNCAENAPITDEVSTSACNTVEPDLHAAASFPLLGLSYPLGAIATGAEAGISSLPKGLPPCHELMPVPVIDDLSLPSPSQSGVSTSTHPNAPACFEPADIPLPPSVASTRPASPVHTQSSQFQATQSLSSVLLLTDDLFSRFPPSTPELCLSRTFGPASVMRTWAEDAAKLPSDDQAEAFVVAGIDIVARYELEPVLLEKELQRGLKRDKAGRRKARRGSARLVVGAVLVLGVAVAVGVHTRGSGREADWRALLGALSVVGEKMLGMFGDPPLGL
ncbi:rab-GTPase-TBC domain-containing protein [Russula earlei]|uniref:Rab-GTPase-TBC domain-containing protein n=1 Tax=Russula earlei TaxID=71964 RepID=A0ACC0UD63_9AGAM|nr:rab-GTPase-TBC domain-containing protein [Russula earlei]